MPIVSPNIRVRVPDHFDIGDNSIVDDWCYFSVRVKVGVGSHIANNVSIAGGPEQQFTMGDYSSLSAGVRVWCASNDFSNDLIAIGGDGLEGDVALADYTGVGANAVLMPGVILPEGCAVGALSYVPAFAELEPWSVYAGVPVRRVADRNRERALSQAEHLRRVQAKVVDP